MTTPRQPMVEEPGRVNAVESGVSAVSPPASMDGSGDVRPRYAIWLFFSTIFMPSVDAGTLWNNIIVALVVFVLSLAPAGGTRSASPGHPAHD